MNVKKDILKPVLITLAILILIFGVSLLIMHFCFPYSMGQMCYKLGADGSALTYFEKDFEKSKNYDELYGIINLSIKLDKNQKVVDYYEKFSSNENYENFILNIDEKNRNIDVSNLVKSKLYSEDNYLKNRYVLSLAKLNRLSDAFNYAKDNSNFMVEENNLSPYLFTFISNEDYFVDCEESQNIVNEMVIYFNNLFDSFKINYANLDNTIFTFVLGSRINEVGNNLKSLKSLNYSVELTNEQINETLLQVNQKMALLN